MRYFSADIIFPIHRSPVRNGILVTDDEGKILDLLDPEVDEISDSLPVERIAGIICPGFVNTHCHLELSHLKGKMTQKKTLPYFINEIITKRNALKESIMDAMKEADEEMFKEGIVAVSDISNSEDSVSIKRTSRIHYHTFIELFDIFPEKARRVFDDGLILKNEFTSRGLKASLVPHSPYTVTEGLMRLIIKEAERTNGILSIHNQETLTEDEMFENGTGALIDKLQELTGAYSQWRATGSSSLRTMTEYFQSGLTTLLVHNTFTKKDDIAFALEKIPDLFWCLCVKANLFIENKLPDILSMREKKCMMTIGTDSYASNTSLSVLDELKTISNNFPEIGLDELLKWATLNGSLFLKNEENYGSFEKGKTPGINQIFPIDTEKVSLNEESMIKRII